MPRRSKSPVVVPTGSRICGGCGMPNEATRRFCAKCGFSLVDAKIVRKAPWWRRLLGRERVYAAGTRIRPSGTRRRIHGMTRLVALLAVLAGAGILAGPQRGLVTDGVHWVQNAVSDPFQVRPESPKASGSVGKQTAPLAFDGARNTYWAAPRSGRTARPVPVLIGTFPKPVKLVRFGIWPGVSDQTPKFVAGPRPAEIELTLNTGTGPIVKRFPVKDTPTFQQFDFTADDVRTFQLAVTRTTRPTRAILTAIAEVEFFAHR